MISIYDGCSRIIFTRISDTQKNYEDEAAANIFWSSGAMYDDIRIFF